MSGPVLWSYLASALVLGLGVATTVLRGEWRSARGVDKLLVLGPALFAAPLAAFGTEHFTVTAGVASIVPAWIPWPTFWVYLLGVCFIAAAVSVAAKFQARLSASLLALTFFLFVALMHGPGWLQEPGNRFALAVVLRETSFGAGALALAVSLTEHRGPFERGLTNIARIFVAVPVLFFSFEQFMHGDYVPAIPLDRLTPGWLFGHAVWTYLSAVVYAIGGVLLLIGKKPRAAATWVGASVLFVELVVYAPIGVVDRSSLQNGLNYVADTLMFAGAVLLLAGALPREAALEE